jgi:hypothetical protein
MRNRTLRGLSSIEIQNPLYMVHLNVGEQATAGGVAIYGGPIGLYVARKMASFIVTAFAWARRSAPMILVVSLLRGSTDVFDVIHNTIAGTLATARSGTSDGRRMSGRADSLGMTKGNRQQIESESEPTHLATRTTAGDITR